MFNKILIANRGEIACRIIKTARRMGIESVAVYSIADRNSLHVMLADVAFCIGEPPAKESYLNIDAIITAASASGAQAIHPGYGFLSENPSMARACEHAGIVFIGPPIPAMEAMASKQLAKQMLEKTHVPLIPGYHGKAQSDKRLLLEAQRLGFPILLKAARGGGGKGMRVVQDEVDFFQDLDSARREAQSSFGDETMLIEKLIRNPRHVEIQIMADNHGQMVHLFDRDCSIQRRHQKIIEEAPAPNLSTTLRQGLANAAIAVSKAIDYRGAGTVEFLVEGNQHFYFMEMNTRLQVEHAVTEMITGLDLVEWQLRIAANEPLPCKQDQVHANGHAIECRIYAEDPRNGFIPSIGQLHFLSEPTGIGVRIDSGVISNSVIPTFYDPMISKLIAWGETRIQALQRLQLAVMNYHVGGIKTNLPFLQGILQHPRFINSQLSTNFLNQETIEMPTLDKHVAVLMAASVDYLTLFPQNDCLLADTFSWQMHLKSHWYSSYWVENEQINAMVTPISSNQVALKIENETSNLYVTLIGNELHLDDGKQVRHALVEFVDDTLVFYTELGSIVLERFNWQHLSFDNNIPNNPLNAPMAATVVAILKNKGDKIKAGERLMVLEAMKMEHAIYAPTDGLLVDIFYEIGAQVNEGAPLISLTNNTIRQA